MQRRNLMIYEDIEIQNSKLFTSNKKILLVGIIQHKYDKFIDFYIKSHEELFLLSFYNNYPYKPFIECIELNNFSEYDFHLDEINDCNIYMIEKLNQELLDINITDKFINTNLFSLNLNDDDVFEKLINKNSSLIIEENVAKITNNSSAFEF
jgi:hypothetical protein